MKRLEAFSNIRKLLKEERLVGLCWAMVVYDTQIQDLQRIVVSMKAIVIDGGKEKRIFFQDYIYDVERDSTMLKDAFSLSALNFPDLQCDFEAASRSIDAWANQNKEANISDVEPDMFSTSLT